MAVKIKPLRKFSTGNPVLADMEEGEIAVNTADQKIFMRDDSNNVVEVANASGSAADDITTGDSDVTIATTVGHITIDNQANNKDIIFKGTDNNSVTDALTLNMSDKGTAEFNQNIKLRTDNAFIKFGQNNEISLQHVHDTGLLLNSTSQLQFFDSDESVSSDGTNLILKSGGTSFKIPTSDGGTGTFLKTDGSGNLSFAAASGGGLASDSDGNTFGGTGALANVTSGQGLNNTAIGKDAANDITTGDENVIIGFEAGATATTGGQNVFIGSGAAKGDGSNAVTGTHNVAIGESALEDLQAASSLVAIGRLAMQKTHSADNSVAIGTMALQDGTDYSYVTAVGTQALTNLTTGSYNTAVGVQTGQGITDETRNTLFGYSAGGNIKGSNNTAIGNQALNYTFSGDQTGANNTGLGYRAGFVIEGGDQNTFVGYQSGQAMTTGNNNVILGGYDGNSGGVDLRTSDNNVVLSDGAGNIRGRFDSSSNLFLAGNTNILTSTGGTLTLQNSSTAISANDVLGKIEFQAPNEATGGTADDVLGAIEFNATSDISSTTKAFTEFTIKGSSSSNINQEIVTILGDGSIAMKGDLSHSGSGAFSVSNANGNINLVSSNNQAKVQGNDVFLNSLTSMLIKTQAGDITIDATGADTDIIFKGTDNTTDITALTLDMSDAGTAIFNHDVKLDGTISSNATINKYGSSSSPIVFAVTVATQTAAHPYNGDGSANKYSIDGVQGAALELHGADATTSSSEYYYRFDQSDSSNSGHPLRFYLDAAKTTAYTTGVTTNGTPGNAGAYTQIAVDKDTPKTLYYQCNQHGYMGNYVTIVNSTTVGTGTISIKNTGTQSQLRLYCESNNAHYVALQAPAHANFSGNPVLTLPSDTGILISTVNSDAPTTTTSSSDADFVLIDDGGTMKKITPTNLGIGSGGGGGAPNAFSKIDVSGQSQVEADNNADTLTLVAGSNMTITTNASSDTITFASSGGSGSAGVTVQDEGSALSTTGTTLNFVGAGVVASGTGATKTITIPGGGSTDSFKTISVSGQSNVVADSSTDTLTLVAGNNMTITTNASGDEISFAASGGAGSGISEEQAIAFAIVYG